MFSLEGRTVFYGVNDLDSNDRIMLEAANDGLAKVELLDQLGYRVAETARIDGPIFFIQDVEMDEDSIPLKSTTYAGALDEALKAMKWHVTEPMDLIGGSMPSGMGVAEED